MATDRIGRLLVQLHHCCSRQGGPSATDGQLLERFLASRDESAFETLVRRHGPMVLGVCRRVLGNVHDAEDAFQATFLVLVRRAPCVWPREQVGNWLHGVAYRTALKARGRDARRRTRERRAGEARLRWTVPAGGSEEWLPLLDEELNRLPEMYRVAVVLCDLEGRPRKEAAQALGWPEGTLSGRLARARALLAKRLTRHGLQPSAGVVLAVLAGQTTARPAGQLIRSTVAAGRETAAGVVGATEVVPTQVAALAEGVASAMAKTKRKVVLSMLLLAAVLCAGWGTLAPAGVRARPADGAEDAEAGPVSVPPPRSDTGKSALLGRWWLTRTAFRGKEPNQDAQARRRANWIITSQKIIALLGNEEVTAEYAYEVDSTFTPARFNLIPLSGPDRGKSLRGIFLPEGDTLKVCHTIPEEDRPTAFATRRDVPWTLLVFERDHSLPAAKASPSNRGPQAMRADELFKVAEFYRRTGHPESERYLLELLLRRFPEAGLAPKVVERLSELDQQEKREKKGTTLRFDQGRERPVPTGNRDIAYSRSLEFQIPFQVDQSAHRLVELRLFVSADQGKTYRLVSRATPDQKTFAFRSANDGVFWFAVQSVDANGRTFPEDVAASRALVKICVDTRPPKLKLFATGSPKGGQVLLRWTVEDENLDQGSLKLEYRASDKTEWMSLPIKQTASGSYRWKVPPEAPPMASLEIRLRACDRAGNVAECTVSPDP
jgi:RNA polymerase sigma factor (sigma-70 family)